MYNSCEYICMLVVIILHEEFAYSDCHVLNSTHISGRAHYFSGGM